MISFCFLINRLYLCCIFFMKYPEGLGVFFGMCECVSEECGLEIVFFVCVECDVRSLSLTLSFPKGRSSYIR